MRVVRGFGEFLIGVAIFCLGFDLGMFWVTGGYAPQTLSQIWAILHADSLAAASLSSGQAGQAVTESLRWALVQPAFALFFAPGLLIRGLAGLADSRTSA